MSDRTPAQRWWELAVTKSDMAGAAFHRAEEVGRDVALLLESTAFLRRTDDVLSNNIGSLADRLHSLEQSRTPEPAASVYERFLLPAEGPEPAASDAAGDELCAECKHWRSSHNWQGGRECNQCQCNRFVPAAPASAPDLDDRAMFIRAAACSITEADRVRFIALAEQPAPASADAMVSVSLGDLKYLRDNFDILRDEWGNSQITDEDASFLASIDALIAGAS